MTDIASPSVALSPRQYNAALIHPTVRTALQHFARCNADVDSSAFIGRLGSLASFPEITVGSLIATARDAGVDLKGFHASVDELESISAPFLVFLKRRDAPDAPVDLVQVDRLKRRRVTISLDRFGEQFISREELLRRWSGVVLTIAAGRDGTEGSELARYRNSISVLPGFLQPDECRDLIDYCERIQFSRSRIMQRRADTVDDVIEARVRSSASVVLADRQHPLLARLYRRCADLEALAPHHIETIQCVRYKRGQRFRAHFDGGIDLPRLTTYLLYLNDDFAGGETYFPMLDHAVAPQVGACLRFTSCDPAGRIKWQSEHGGLPVTAGVKYALNIWVRCPDQPFIAAPQPPHRPLRSVDVRQ